MYSFRKSLLSYVGLLGLVITLAALTPPVGRGQGNSGNAPPTLDVNVVNTPRVVVANTPDETAEAAYVPLAGQWALESFSAASDTYIVPAGKRLVIEHVSSFAELHPGQAQTYILLRVTQGTASFQHFLEVTQPIAFTLTQAFASSSQPLRLYVDAGEAVQAVSGRNSNENVGYFSMQVSGYLVDVP